MKIYNTADFPIEISDSNLFFDTNAIILAYKFADLLSPLWKDLQERGCVFLTTSSVFFEFIRGADTVEKFNDKVGFVKTLFGNGVIQIEKIIGINLNSTMVVFKKMNDNLSFTDFLLCAALKFYPDSLLISSDTGDLTTRLLDRIDVLTIDTDKNVHNYGIYKFSTSKYNKAATNILGGNP